MRKKDAGGLRAGTCVDGAGLKGPHTVRAQLLDVLGKADLQGPGTVRGVRGPGGRGDAEPSTEDCQGRAHTPCDTVTVVTCRPAFVQTRRLHNTPWALR